MIFDYLEKAINLSSDNSELLDLMLNIKTELTNESLKVNSSSYTMYLIGVDIPEGLYKIENIKEDYHDSGTIKVMKDAKFDKKSLLNEEEVIGSIYFEFENGQFIKLERVKILHKIEL